MSLLCTYVFLIYSRAPEVIGSYVGSLHLAMILMAILICFFFLSGWLSKTIFSPPGMAQLAFTGWMLCCIPLSVWPGGSLNIIIFEWLPSLITFFVTAGLISTVKDSERLTRTMAIGVVTILGIYLMFGGSSMYGGSRVGTNIGTMGNPNLFALQLLMGMPFCLYGIYRSKLLSLKGAFYMGVLLATLYLVVSTGSRSGLISLGVGLLILLLRSSVLGKLGLIAMVLVALLGAAAVLPRETLNRYMTTFSNDRAQADGDLEILSAMDSAAARRHHLEQSIQLTFQHPVFGVGAGQFRVAAADLSHKSRENAAWLETHNSWTQVSSETGFPGIFLYLTVILYCFKHLFSQYRATRKNPQFSDIADMTFCLLLSLALTIINMTFASAAYQPGLPLLCGLAVGLLRGSEKAIREANQMSGTVSLVQPSPLVWAKRVTPIPHTPALKTDMRRTGKPRSF